MHLVILQDETSTKTFNNRVYRVSEWVYLSRHWRAACPGRAGVLVTFCITDIKVHGKKNLWKERFVLAHGFRWFSPSWFRAPIFSWAVHIMVGRDVQKMERTEVEPSNTHSELSKSTFQALFPKSSKAAQNKHRSKGRSFNTWAGHFIFNPWHQEALPSLPCLVSWPPLPSGSSQVVPFTTTWH